MAVNERGRGDGDIPAPPDDARIAALYREAAREEPPAWLDHAIAARAREQSAVQARSTPWWMAWRVPFAVAALAVVSVSLVTLMVDEDPERAITLQEMPARPASPSEPAASSAPPPAAQAPTTPEASQAARADAIGSLPSQAVPPAPKAKLAEPDSVRSPPPAALESRERGPAPPSDALRQPRELAALPPPVQSPREPQPFPAGREAGPAPAPATPPGGLTGENMTGSNAPARLESAAPAEGRAARDAGALQRRAADAAAAKPAPAPRAAPAPAQAETSALRAQSADIRRHIVELEHEMPAAWVERVLALRKEGRTAEAEALLMELRKRHPGVVLPAELK